MKIKLFRVFLIIYAVNLINAFDMDSGYTQESRIPRFTFR